MQTVVLLSCFVFFCSAQVGDQIAVDLFNYSSNVTSSWNGGSGFESGWRAEGSCVQTALPRDATPSTFTRFATTSMIGLTSTGRTRQTCSISRTVSDSGVDLGGLFVSVLLVRRQAVPGSPASTTAAFGVAIGELNSGEAWDSDLDLSGDRNAKWFGIRGFQTTQLMHETQLNDATRFSGTLNSSTLAYFVVCESELQAPPRQLQARCAVMDPHKAVTMEQARMPSSFSFTVPTRWAISIGVSDFFVAQVLVGKTFESVYDKVPSASTTTTSTTTAAMPPRITTTTTTTKATTSLTINPKLATTATSPTVTTTNPALISTTTASGMLPTTTTSPSLSPSSSSLTCQSATNCLACFAIDGCKWCERWRNASTDANQCIAELDSECLTLTLSTDGCGTNNNQMMDEASLPVAIIAGAIGGGVALLLLIALVICLAMRSRRSKRATQAASSATEMATARESSSIAKANDDETYGELRLTNVYSAAGLSLTPNGGSVKSDTTGASGSGGDPHYSPMEMH